MSSVSPPLPLLWLMNPPDTLSSWTKFARFSPRTRSCGPTMSRYRFHSIRTFVDCSTVMPWATRAKSWRGS